MDRIVECVPNFSEGRNALVVEAIAGAARLTGAAVLHTTLDPDHHRSVITLAGDPGSIAEAAFRAVERAVALIDLRVHRGVHLRLGAADVVPFVPVRGVSLEDCVALAVSVGERIWRELGVPVYLYEAAARHPDRVRLENVRRGQFEGLSEEVRTNPERLPDFGTSELHPSAGAVIVGARKFLVAYNINLDTPDVEVARRIARSIRTSSGGMPCVKAMGLLLASRNQAQVSMNLTDFETTPVGAVYAAVKTLAAEHGARIAGGELIGLIPEAALQREAEWFRTLEAFDEMRVIENAIAAA